MLKEDLMFFNYIRRPEETTLDETRRRFFREMPEIDDLHIEVHRQLGIMFREFKRVCDQNNIPYFLMGGCYIGAVRAGKMIPWDLDGDVGMVREDYERFREAVQGNSIISLSEERKASTVALDSQRRPICFIMPKIYIRSGSKAISIDVVIWDRVRIPAGWTFRDFWRTRRDYRNMYQPDAEHDSWECLSMGSAAFREVYCEPDGDYLCFAVENFPSIRAVIQERILKYDTVFPLRQISFLDDYYSIPNDGDTYIEGEWGDIWSLPIVNTLSGARKLEIKKAAEINRAVLEGEDYD